jgi:hypothetical protein
MVTADLKLFNQYFSESTMFSPLTLIPLALFNFTLHNSLLARTVSLYHKLLVQQILVFRSLLRISMLSAVFGKYLYKDEDEKEISKIIRIHLYTMLLDFDLLFSLTEYCQAQP